MKKLFRFSLIILISSSTYLPTISAQTRIDWINLADVTFEEKKDSVEALFSYNHATFGENLLALAGHEVSITGYMIPIDPMGINFVLSRNPNSSCFFCGGAGPETVLQLNMKKRTLKRYSTDDRLTFKGKLQLNEKDIDRLTYVLEEAEEL